MKNNNKEKWETHIKSWEESGLSQAKYCLQYRLNKDTFGKWKQRLQREASVNGFVEITNDGSGKGLGLTISINDRIKVEVKRGFDRKLLKEVIEAAEDL